MTPTELRECLAVLRWTQRRLATVLGCDEGLVRRWARGAAEIPSDVAQWLRKLAQLHGQHPPPVWKRRAA